MIKGKKFYAVAGDELPGLYYTADKKEEAKKGLDTNTPYLVEVMVTRIWVSNPDLTELQTGTEL